MLLSVVEQNCPHLPKSPVFLCQGKALVSDGECGTSKPVFLSVPPCVLENLEASINFQEDPFSSGSFATLYPRSHYLVGFDTEIEICLTSCLMDKVEPWTFVFVFKNTLKDFEFILLIGGKTDTQRSKMIAQVTQWKW